MLILASVSAATIAGSLWAPWGEPPGLRKTPPSVDGGAGLVYPEDILPPGQLPLQRLLPARQGVQVLG